MDLEVGIGVGVCDVVRAGLDLRVVGFAAVLGPDSPYPIMRTGSPVQSDVRGPEEFPEEAWLRDQLPSLSDMS